MKNKFYYLIFIFLFLTNARCWAEDLKINEIKLTHLSIPAGDKISLFYVNGREPAIGAIGHRLQVVSIVAVPVVGLVDAAQTVTFPAVSIPRRAGFVNYLLFSVHRTKQAEVSIRNADSKWVSDLRNIAAPEEGQKYGQISLLKLSNLQSDPNIPVELNAKDVFTGP